MVVLMDVPSRAPTPLFQAPILFSHRAKTKTNHGPCGHLSRSEKLQHTSPHYLTSPQTYMHLTESPLSPHLISPHYTTPHPRLHLTSPHHLTSLISVTSHLSSPQTKNLELRFRLEQLQHRSGRPSEISKQHCCKLLCRQREDALSDRGWIDR
jgi:hypothetical protein